MKKLKEVGVVNLILGLVLLTALSLAARWWIADSTFYMNADLVEVLFDESAARLRDMCLYPFVLALAAFVWMYLNYTAAADRRDYRVAGRQVRHALIPGLVLLAAELVVALLLLPLLAGGQLTAEEAVYEGQILAAYRNTNLLCAAVDMVLYILAALFLRPNRVMQ